MPHQQMPVYSHDHADYIRKMHDWHMKMHHYHDQLKAYHLERAKHYHGMMGGTAPRPEAVLEGSKSNGVRH